MVSSVPDLGAVGIKADPPLASQFREEVAKLLGRRSTSFPGAQPVSFATRHILELEKQDYYVCEKTDGVRCLLYFTHGDGQSEIHYLIDRKNDYYYVAGLHFPILGDSTFREFHVNTLLDGELVYDTYENGEQQLKYLVFDCLAVDGKNLMHRTLDKRLAYFQNEVLKPYDAMFKRFPEEKQHRPFALEGKSTQLGYGIEMMFRDIIPSVKTIHGNDGLIFTCRSTSYQIGTDEHIIKWKPPTENTVDFRLRLEFPLLEPDTDDEADGITAPYYDYDALPIFHLFVLVKEGEYCRFGEMYVSPSEWEDLKALGTPLDNILVECYQDAQHRWRFHRIRNDKDEANHISTVAKVMESIEDRVTEDDLIQAAPAIKSAWRRRQALAMEEERKRKEEDRRKAEEARRRREEGQRKAEEVRRRESLANGANGNGLNKKI